MNELDAGQLLCVRCGGESLIVADNSIKSDV